MKFSGPIGTIWSISENIHIAKVGTQEYYCFDITNHNSGVLRDEKSNEKAFESNTITKIDVDQKHLNFLSAKGFYLVPCSTCGER